MITTRLSGGLGNMMFQISVAYSVGFDNNDTDIFFNFNDAFYPHKTAHQYKDTIFRNIKEGIPKPDYRFKETFFHHYPISYANNLLLEGYFQSEKYFKHHRKEILELFSMDDNTSEYIFESNSNILNSNIASLHVRRGNYKNLPDHHPVLDEEYYFKDGTLFQGEYHQHGDGQAMTGGVHTSESQPIYKKKADGQLFNPRKKMPKRQIMTLKKKVEKFIPSIRMKSKSYSNKQKIYNKAVQKISKESVVVKPAISTAQKASIATTPIKTKKSKIEKY